MSANAEYISTAMANLLILVYYHFRILPHLLTLESSFIYIAANTAMAAPVEVVSPWSLTTV